MFMRVTLSILMHLTMKKH